VQSADITIIWLFVTLQSLSTTDEAAHDAVCQFYVQHLPFVSVGMLPKCNYLPNDNGLLAQIVGLCLCLPLHDFPSWQWGRWLSTFFIVWQCGNWHGVSDEPTTCCRRWHLWACSNNTSCCWIMRGLSISVCVCKVFGLDAGPEPVLRGLATPQSYNKQRDKNI